MEKSAFLIQLEEWGEAVVLRLQDPGRLRIAVLGLVGALGLGAMGLPMYRQILLLQAAYAQELARNIQIKQHRSIETQVRKLKRRLNQKADLNTWIEYLLEATRGSGLKVVEFRPVLAKGKQAQVGVLQGIFLDLDVFGSFVDVLKFIGRLENDKDLIRVTQVSLTKDTVSAPLKTSMTIAVLMRKASGVVGEAEPGGGAAAAPSKPAAPGNAAGPPSKDRGGEE